MEVGISFVHIYREKLCAAPGPGVASVNLALHLVCSLTSSSVSEWSVCEVCLSKHSPVMFTQHQPKDADCTFPDSATQNKNEG